MPPQSECEDNNNTSGQGNRGRGGRRGRRGRGASKQPSTRVHANGSAEISFQANIIPGAALPVQAMDQSRLPTLSEEPAPQEARIGGPAIPDSPSNPFSRTYAQHPDSPGEESFPEPSPAASTASSSISGVRATPPRARASKTPSRRSVGQSRPASTANARALPKKKKGAVDVWTFFKDTSEGRFCVFCQHQQSIDANHEVFAFGADTSTTTLRTHLFSNHVDMWVDSCDKFKIAITAETAKGPVAEYRASKDGAADPSSTSYTRPPDLRKYSYEAFVDAVTQFIIADDQSLNVIESPHLRKIFMMLREDLKDSDIPHRTAIRNHIKTLWDEHLDALQADLKNAPGKISLTTDLWSDPNLSPFMAVTGHWIELKILHTADGPQYELKLRAELIGFHRVPGRHTGEHLAQAFLYILDRLGITSKIGWVTLDNASNNETFMEALELELRARGIAFDSYENRIRCFPHIVNLACKAVLSALAKVDYMVDDSAASAQSGPTSQQKDPISTLRLLIRMIRVSSLRRQHFSDVSKTYNLDLQLLRDVDIRWSSTLYMIERALILEKPLDIVSSSPEFADLKQYHLSDAQWDALATVREILLVPDAFQQKLSAEKTPTLCNALPSFDAMITIWKELQENWGSPISDIIQDGIDKLTTYQDRVELVPAYTIAMLLNPSMKLQYIPSSQHDDAIKLLRRTLLPYYEKNASSRNSNTNDIPVPMVQPAVPTGQSAFGANYTPRRSRAIRGRSLRNSTAHRTADEILGLTRGNTRTAANGLDAEIRQYLADSSTNTCSLAYWQEHRLHYPTFFAAALDYLAIQGSSVPCERVFSSAKETMTDRRNRINEELMEMLQMIKFRLKGGNTLDFAKGTSKEDIIAYLESVSDAELAVPEDINSYIQSLLSTVQ